MLLEYDPLSQRAIADPYPIYRALREHEPVHWSGRDGVFCVSRYEDVARVLRDPACFSSCANRDVLMNANLGPMRPRLAAALLSFLFKAGVNPFALQRTDNLVSLDPPRHDAMRATVNRGFTPRRIALWEGRARAIVAERLEPLRRGEPFDVVEQLAVPLPLLVISEMLGVELHRRDDFRRWTRAIISLASGSAKTDPVKSGVIGELAALFAYLKGIVRARRRDPQDDLVSVLVDPANGEALSDLDAVLFVVLLLVAGSETTTHLIGNATRLLLDRPELTARVADDPSLVPNLVEETLRFDPPIQLAFRSATCEIELAGTVLEKGAVVIPMLASANRDEARFRAADRFDIDRDSRGHLGFGQGVHFCLGSSLARLEARVALEALIPELLDVKPVGGPDAFVDSFLVRGRAAIRVESARGGSGSGAHRRARAV
jgi:cytochrome P450